MKGGKYDYLFINISYNSIMLNKKYNVICENFKKFRKEKKLSQRALCQKLELLGVTLYKADIYAIEHNKRAVKDFELLAFSIVFEKSVEDFYIGVKDFE